MMKKAIIIAIIAMILPASGAVAQEIQKQAGFRFGNTTGFTGKIIRDDVFAFEGILGFRSGGAQLYGLFEARRPIFYDRIENMYAYFGGGVHFGFSTGSSGPNTPSSRCRLPSPPISSLSLKCTVRS